MKLCTFILIKNFCKTFSKMILSTVYTPHPSCQKCSGGGTLEFVKIVNQLLDKCTLARDYSNNSSDISSQDGVLVLKGSV